MSSSDHHDSGDCDLRVRQQLALIGEVKIKPFVDCGPPTVRCLETRIAHGNDEHSSTRRHHHDDHRTCRVLVHQVICVEVPVRFRAEAVCELERIVCGPATTDELTSLPLPGDSTGEETSGSSHTSGSDDLSDTSGCDSSSGQSE